MCGDMGSDTIFALASAPGAAGVSVLRVSGPLALQGFQALSKKGDITPRQVVYTVLKDPENDQLIDQAVATYFKAPYSYTGEDVIEYTVHGSPAVVQKMIDVLSDMSGYRMADPGEFTKRAFLNEKLDLTAAEAVHDLIQAETEAQRMLALDQLGGSLETLYHDWAGNLSKLLAHQEAEIEFPDEDMPDGVDDAVIEKIHVLMADMSTHLDDQNRGERMRQGMQIAIIGAPNVGKSSLLNILARREVAIVSDLAGTTRDIVDVSLNLGGYPVVISDTAGIRNDHSDKVEAEGIRRAIQKAEEADLKIILLDATTMQDGDGVSNTMADQDSLVVINKIDQMENFDKDNDRFYVSCETQEGVDTLVGALSNKVKAFFDKGGHQPVLTRARHRAHIQDSYQYLERALSADLPELAAEDLRQALQALGRITGRVDVEQLLDIVFKDFCIGK